MIAMKLVMSLFIAVLAFVLLALAVPGALADAGGVHGSIAGRVTTVHNIDYADLDVVLVNASNTSEIIPNFTSAVDKDGFYQFVDVPAGDYKVMAQGPYLATGMSNHVPVIDNVTYWSAIILTPAPYYSNISVAQNPIPLEGGTTAVTVTVYDYWGNPVGAGLFVEFTSTSGELSPAYGLTDANSQFTSTLTAPANGTYADIYVYSLDPNGTYYPLQEYTPAVNVTPTPAPTARPSVTPAPSSSPSPTSITPTASPSASSTVTAKATPGFELIVGLVAIGLVGLCLRKKSP